MTEPITVFRGPHYFMSNFMPAEVVLDGLYYPTVENAYQASKTLDHADRVRFVGYAPAKAKREGRRLAIRPDWREVRIGIMHDLLRQKFGQNHGYNVGLRRTGDAELIEGNYWGDKFWGVFNGEGDNHLGKLLMLVREELIALQGPYKYA